MKKTTIGFITNSRLLTEKEADRFKRVAEKMDIDLVFFNSADKMDLTDLKTRAKECDIIYNDDGEFITIELAKTLEALAGKIVVEPTKTFYYTEDKWLQYVMCVKHGIPAPKTILLPSDLVSARKEIVDFNHFPVIIKRIEGCRGEFVDKANTADEAVEVIKKFWTKGENRFPVLAQEFVDSSSYRVFVIGGEVVQTALKKSNRWKATGVDSASFDKFEIDSEMKAMLDKLTSVTDLTFCGFDFAKHNGQWVFIEINGNPSFDFYENEYDLMVEKVLAHLRKMAEKKA